MILIVKSLNITPEKELNKRLAPLLEQGYRVISASTSMMAHGTIESAHGMRGMALYFEIARHIYYTTTVILEKP